MQRTEEALDKIKEDISEIKVTLATNTQSLGEHMRRTMVLENRLDSLSARALTALSIISALIIIGKELLR